MWLDGTWMGFLKELEYFQIIIWDLKQILSQSTHMIIQDIAYNTKWSWEYFSSSLNIMLIYKLASWHTCMLVKVWPLVIPNKIAWQKTSWVLSNVRLVCSNYIVLRLVWLYHKVYWFMYFSIDWHTVTFILSCKIWLLYWTFKD